MYWLYKVVLVDREQDACYFKYMKESSYTQSRLARLLPPLAVVDVVAFDEIDIERFLT